VDDDCRRDCAFCLRPWEPDEWVVKQRPGLRQRQFRTDIRVKKIPLNQNSRSTSHVLGTAVALLCAQR
jgi:hypothetical protein